MKRIVTIQDISCVGKCSLTVALPIISACGVECAVVLTGVSLRPGELGAMGYSAASGTFFYHASEHLPVSFHGTGDVFASALVGALTRERSLDDAVGVAVDYTVECLRETMRDPNHVSYGVNFETAIPYLLTRLGLAAGE